MEFFATCNGIPVHISDSKKGDKVILLLHGYLETLYIWHEFRLLLPANIRVIAIDLPGHGLSGSNKSSNSMTFCADVIRDVLQVCKVNSCSVLGHSMGGYIAIEAVKLYPELFEKLIFMHSTPYPDSLEKSIDRDREIALIEQGKLPLIVKTAIPKMFSPLNIREFDEKIFEITELTETHDPDGIVASIRGLKSRNDNFEFYKSLSIPVFSIFGTHDNYILLDVANTLIAARPASKYLILEKSGHIGFIEEAQLVADNLITFLE